MASNIKPLPETPRILVVRTDRIGDMVLTLPLFASLRKARPKAFIAAMVRGYARELVEGRDDVDEIISFDSPGAHLPLGQILPMAARLRTLKFDAAILPYLKTSAALAVALAGIPARIGPATKTAQVFLTHRITQRRSKSLKNEADHNLELLAPLGVPPVREAIIPVDKSLPAAFNKSADRPLVGLHPGQGGSARAWPLAHWEELARRLAESGCGVAVTGAPHERDMVDRVAAGAGDKAQKYIGDGGLRRLAKALSELDLFVAGSTGPLHIASAVGTPVVGIYCPIFVCLPERWGPIGPGAETVRPEVAPCDYCLGKDCPHFDCMDAITPAQVAERARIRLRLAAAETR